MKHFVFCILFTLSVLTPYTCFSMKEITNSEMDKISAQSGLAIIIKDQEFRQHIGELILTPSNATYVNVFENPNEDNRSWTADHDYPADKTDTSNPAVFGETDLIFSDINFHGNDSDVSPFSIKSANISMDITSIDNQYPEIRVNMADMDLDLAIDVNDINFCGNSDENGKPVSSSLYITGIEIPEQHLYISSANRYENYSNVSNNGLALEVGMQLTIDSIHFTPGQQKADSNQGVYIRGLMVGESFNMSYTSLPSGPNPNRISVEEMQNLADTWEPQGKMLMGDLDLDPATVDWMPNDMAPAVIVNIATGQRPPVHTGGDITYTPPSNGNDNTPETYLHATIPQPPGSIRVKDFKFNGESFGPICADNVRGYMKIEIPGRGYEYSHIDTYPSYYKVGHPFAE